jgi:hypothetical protein
MQKTTRRSLKDAVDPKPAAPGSGLLDFDGLPAAAVYSANLETPGNPDEVSGAFVGLCSLYSDR